MTTFNDLPNEIKDMIAYHFIKVPSYTKLGWDGYSRLTCRWECLRALVEVWPGMRNSILVAASDMKRAHEADAALNHRLAEQKRAREPCVLTDPCYRSKTESEELAERAVWQSKLAKSMDNLIDEIRYGPGSGKGCWTCRIKNDIMTNIAWWDTFWISLKNNRTTILKAATRLVMRNDLFAFQSERDYWNSFEGRWFKVWDSEPMLREMFKATSMTRSAVEERVREKRETMRRLWHCESVL